MFGPNFPLFIDHTINKHMNNFLKLFIESLNLVRLYGQNTKNQPFVFLYIKLLYKCIALYYNQVMRFNILLKIVCSKFLKNKQNNNKYGMLIFHIKT